MYQYALDNGFAARCNARGITDPAQVQGLMKVAHDLVSHANRQIQKQATKKQALSPQHQSMLIGGLGGAGLGAGIGGLLSGWRGAGMGGLAGAGIGTATGAALGPMATEAYEKYKKRQKFLRKREGEMKRIMHFSPSTAAAGIGREAAHLVAWKGYHKRLKEVLDDIPPKGVERIHPFDQGWFLEDF